ncbi:MAG: hypothetical protein RMM31_09825 [Anaerolineae bacterium]|nr:hypothetical protein [Thermoflexales bacterium]MDW8396527.1 hypothetical protein [Anaerolineae bacterium]
MKRDKRHLTEEDQRWLEARLRQALAPVSPDPTLVMRMRERVLSSRVGRPFPSWVAPSALAALGLALLALLVSLLYFYRRSVR